MIAKRYVSATETDCEFTIDITRGNLADALSAFIDIYRGDSHWRETWLLVISEPERLSIEGDLETHTAQVLSTKGGLGRFGITEGDDKAVITYFEAKPAHII